ncbi:MAG: hypothetical protein PVI90_00060 [Desulfobacteraceae bacterium]|jgi:hypothetical protein
MLYKQGIKIACTQLGLIKKAASPQNIYRATSGLIGAARGLGRGALVGGATGALASSPEGRLTGALRGAGLGALLGAGSGGIGSAIRGGRIGRLHGLQGISPSPHKLSREAAIDLVKATRPTLMGPTLAGVLGGLQGAKQKKD